MRGGGILTTELTRACSAAISTRVSIEFFHFLVSHDVCFNIVSCGTQNCLSVSQSLSLSFHGWSATGASGQLRFAPVANHPQILPGSVSLREKLLIPKESPFSGLGLGLGIDLGGRLLEHSSTCNLKPEM